MEISHQIIEACKAKKRKEQRKLYDLLFPYLRAVSTRYLRDSSYQKDVLQESYVKIFNGIDGYDADRGAFKQWAARIVANVALNYNKRVIGLPDEEFKNDIHELIYLPKEFKEIIQNDLLSILKQMPRSYFDVFNLFILEEYGHDDIAKMLKISSGLSRKRLSRARDWIKKTFRNHPKLKSELTSLDKNINS